MPRKSICIKILKIHGEAAIILAKKMQILDRELEFQRVKDFLYIPITHQPSKNKLKTFKAQIPDSEVSAYIFPERKKPVKTFVELLGDRLPPHLLAGLPRALDFVGDIAIVEIPPELNTYREVIGKTVLKVHENVRTVLAKAGPICGAYRLREFDVIAGEPRTETVHKEYGCRYCVDLKKAYFSPRLSFERHRVASLVKEGETVIDLFAGIGPFAILIAKTRDDVRVYALDVNPNAIELLERNTRLNRVEDKVHPILGDARQIVEEKLTGVADRVIMNLPEKAIEFVGVACKAIKPTGGTVHFYSFVRTSDSPKSIELRFTKSVEKCKRKVEEIIFCRLVRATAPYEWQAVLDAKIC